MPAIIGRQEMKIAFRLNRRLIDFGLSYQVQFRHYRSVASTVAETIAIKGLSKVGKKGRKNILKKYPGE